MKGNDQVLDQWNVGSRQDCLQLVNCQLACALLINLTKGFKQSIWAPCADSP